VENLQEDMKGLVKLLNERRDVDLPPLEDNVGWEQKGPLARTRFQVDSEAYETDISSHIEKFSKCGRICFDLARTYYKSDFVQLGYPQTLEDMAD
jgi:hypothetical protein